MNIRATVQQISTEFSVQTKAGKTWTKREFVVRTDGQYPKTICFSLFNKQPNFNEGDTVVVHFELESRGLEGGVSR